MLSSKIAISPESLQNTTVVTKYILELSQLKLIHSPEYQVLHSLSKVKLPYRYSSVVILLLQLNNNSTDMNMRVIALWA
jgi:hypothetical protein